MKTFLFALLATAAVTPALAQNWNYATGGNTARQQTTYQQQTYRTTTVRPVAAQPVAAPVQKAAVEATPASQYRLGNPLYHPRAGEVDLDVAAEYTYVPEEKTIDQPKVQGYGIDPVSVEFGLTNKLSVGFDVGYSRQKIKSGLAKGQKMTSYSAGADLRYLLASASGFDFNVGAGLFYEKERYNYNGYKGTADRRTGADVSLQVGKKIENFITPYFTVGFKSDFWSKQTNVEDDDRGTTTYIMPGVYIDLTDCLSLNLHYISETHEAAAYGGSLDVYPADNIMLSIGGYVVHPETKANLYEGIARVKIAF